MAYKKLPVIIAAGEPENSSDGLGKEAIDICMSAWNSAHDELAEDDDATEYHCEKAGNKAYLKAVPALSGYRNICDFIACINYASMTGVVTHDEATHYLANSRIALSAIRHNPNLFRERKRRKPGTRKK